LQNEAKAVEKIIPHQQLQAHDLSPQNPSSSHLMK